MIKVFISYAHEDEKYKDELAKHMSVLVRQGLLQEWNDRKIKAGEEWDAAIKSKLNDADLIIFLVSKDFFFSDYINNVEIANAIERQKSDKVQILPVLVNYCFYEETFIENFTIYPAEAKPVEAWKNHDEAWLTVIEGIIQSIAKLKNEDANSLISKYNIDSKTDEVEILDKYNLQTPEGQIEIGKKIEKLGLQGPMGNLQLVNVNRETKKEDWWKAYDEKISQKKFFQFYFLSSCPTQMPLSFSERMIYEVINEELDDSPEAIHYETNPDNGRVAIRELPMKRNLQKTIEEFKKYFCRRFDFQDADFDFEKFVKQGIPRLNYQYVVSVFKIHSLKWKDFLKEFFYWVVQTFQQSNEDLPTFIFFFVVYVDKAHLPEKIGLKASSIINELDSLATQNDNSTFFKNLDPVHIDDVKLWFNDLGEEKPDKIEDLIQSMVLGLDSNAQNNFKKEEKLDMSIVEILQELVFKKVNK